MNAPQIKKAARVVGKTLVLRDATPANAAFILSLRTDESRSQHMSKTSASLSEQVAWLERYAARDNEAYFVIESLAGESLGVVRLYDPQGASFCWGSWIMKPGAPASAAIESAMIVYAYALDQLQFTSAHFQVRMDNERVWRFHERFGAVRTATHPDAYDYAISNGAIRQSMTRYARYLPEPITVEHLA